MKEYMRINDDRNFEFDSLEKKCNVLATMGWEVISITQGGTERTATLQREVTLNDQRPTKASRKAAN